MSSMDPGDGPDELGAAVIGEDETEGHLGAAATGEPDTGPDDLGAAVIGNEDDTEGHMHAM